MRPVLIAAMAALLGGFVMTSLSTAEEQSVSSSQRLAKILSHEDAWKQLPKADKGTGQPLPVWIRMLAKDLPKSAAALLELDLAQRTKSPVNPRLRAAMRWVAASANRCNYAQAIAEFDAKHAGTDEKRLQGLASPNYSGWTDAEQAALTFARKMSLDSSSVTDAEFSFLVQEFGERQAASMVLLMAYANFQDRLLICLGATIEADGGPMAAVDVDFPPEAFVVEANHPPLIPNPQLSDSTASDDIEDDSAWLSVTYETLQERLQAQREKPTRLRIPDWEEFAQVLPQGLFRGPSDIVWYRIVFGYAPELAVPYEVYMRTAGAETASQYDRIFGTSLFWVVTRAVNCPYCMGHCEMNWEVAGLTQKDIADRSIKLSGGDWSSFPKEQQHAFAFGRKLSRTPWLISEEDLNGLVKDFGRERALIVALHASRYHYMVRISNGFQLKLESENVFFDYWNLKKPSASKASNPVVPLLSDAEAWKVLPPVESGAGQPLPNWAKAVAAHMPRTAAAMLELDAAHRLKSPLDPILRAKQRWVIAQANRCEYSQAYALADLRRAGVDGDGIKVLMGNPSQWPDADKDALEFARLLTVAAPTIPDALFERLRVQHGERQVAAMVLLAAYGNFQDRIVLGLNLPLEDNGPLAPLDVKFAEGALQIGPLIPPENGSDAYLLQAQPVVPKDEAWLKVSYDELQKRLENQRNRKPRLPIPTWDDVKGKLPAPMAQKPTRIVWSLTNYGYAHELAIPWTIATRTHWAECPGDRILEESLFWIQTRAIGCNYCMGHSEMLLEVAGLGSQAIAHRTKLLAETDWSAFPPAEQRAYAYARKLSQTPWELTEADYRTLEADYGKKEGMALFWWLCRGLYMTRISDGFQLPLERENVFQNVPAPKPQEE